MSIRNSLNVVIKSINDFSRRTNIVAINAAIHASKLESHQGAPFNVLVREIQTMSTQSIDKLSELDGLVNEIAELSILINKTGSQRMLLMKIVNACMLDDQKTMEECSSRFSNQLVEIRASRINSRESLLVVDDVSRKWDDFVSKLDQDTPLLNYQRANDTIEIINVLINKYERHAGEQVA